MHTGWREGMRWEVAQAKSTRALALRERGPLRMAFTLPQNGVQALKGPVREDCSPL